MQFFVKVLLDKVWPDLFFILIPKLLSKAIYYFDSFPHFLFFIFECLTTNSLFLTLVGQFN